MIYGTNTAGKLSTAQTINNLVFTITSYFAAVQRRICFFPKKYLKINPKGTYIQTHTSITKKTELGIS